MKVILKKDVNTLGESGDIVEVKDGYARNYLLPYNIAELATKGALENRERNIERIKAKAQKIHDEALAKADKIKSIQTLNITAKAGENGKLFGAITTRKLAEEILEVTGLEVDRRNISLNNPINTIGSYSMGIKLTSKVSVELPIEVVASEVIKEQFEEESAQSEQTQEEVAEA